MFQALNWTLVEIVRHLPFWVFVTLGVLLTTVTEHYLIPGRAAAVVIAGACVLTVAYTFLMWVMALVLTRSRSRLCLISASRDSVIGMRLTTNREGEQLVLAHHLARRLGQGNGKRLRRAVAPYLAEHLARHPELSLRFTAATPGMLTNYLAETRQWVPEDDGWTYDIADRSVTIRRR
ncbi:MAG: hypothetical protein QG671_3869 [Actinomycetota bacterium]|nr:hypothetical protein [Actinomycetota bacterium]